MNKRLLYFIIFIILIVLCKYYYSNYEVEYKVNGYNIKTKYTKNRFYYEINDGNNTYNFDYYKKRTFKKSLITKIKTIENESFKCIYPTIKDIDTYPLCVSNNEFVDYNLIETDLLDEYKEETKVLKETNKDFIYNNNLSKNEYIAVWNYKGYILMNGKEYENINIFDKDRYDNNLAILIDDTIYMADYNSEYEYKKIYTLNLITKKVDSFELENIVVDFDSYFVGNIGKYLYLFDNKNSVLYEINIKNKKIDIKGNNEKGFVKYNGKDFVTCSKSEYKLNKITYNKNDSIYKYEFNNNKTYKSIKNNYQIKQLISNSKINIIKENKNELYFYLEDKFYKYIPSKGNIEIFYNYELGYNDKNIIFVYNK